MTFCALRPLFIVFPLYFVSGYGVISVISKIFDLNVNALHQSNKVYNIWCIILFACLYGGAFVAFKLLSKRIEMTFLHRFVMLFPLAVLCLGMPLTYLIVIFSNFLRLRIGMEPGLNYAGASLISVLIILTATFIAFEALYKRGKAFESFKLGKKAVYTLLVWFILTNGVQFISFVNEMSFTMVNTSRELRNYFNENTTVIGGIADTLCLENKAFCFTPFLNMNQNPIERFSPQFALIKVYNDGHWLGRPDYISAAKGLLDRFYICPSGNPGGYRFIIELWSMRNLR